MDARKDCCLTSFNVSEFHAMISVPQIFPTQQIVAILASL